MKSKIIDNKDLLSFKVKIKAKIKDRLIDIDKLYDSDIEKISVVSLSFPTSF